MKDDDIRRLALGFIKSSFIDNGEIKSLSQPEQEDWLRSAAPRITLHEVLDDLEIKTASILRAERGWRIRRLLLREGSEVPRELAFREPYYIRPLKEALEVYYLTNEPPARKAKQ